MRVLLLVPLILAAGSRRDDLRPGLLGEYFNVGRESRDFPHLPAGKRPFLRRRDAQVAFEEASQEFAETGLWNHFYVRWTGVLRVSEEGAYVLFARSDDGSAVWIDGKRVVDNGGLHDFKVEKSGTVELKRGDHEIRIEFMENDDKAGIIVSWKKPGGEKEPIPASVLFHKKDAALDPE